MDIPEKLEIDSDFMEFLKEAKTSLKLDELMRLVIKDTRSFLENHKIHEG